jgi:glyoxylase I family protein
LQVVGLVFAGSATEHPEEMTRFVSETLGLERVEVDGVEADLFALADGSLFAISDPGGMGETSRSIGFRVADLEEAIADLRRAGIEVDAPAANDRQRYSHFRAPDGQLYELVEERR